MGRAKVELGGVPETLLWTLYHRAAEARRPDSVIEDPKAVELVDMIDYPFEERFGPAVFGQWQALRAKAFDREIRGFLARSPGGTVVTLGEGLETQFWRVDDGKVRWLTVDLPESVEVRGRLLPAQPPRQRVLACSALHERWMDEVDASAGVLITAQGLLMYLDPPDVHRLIAACAARFPGGALLFDAIPRWFSTLSTRGLLKTDGFTAPPMPWAMDTAERKLIAAQPGVARVRRVRPPGGRGVVHRLLLPVLGRTPVARNLTLSIQTARFGH